jgi:hypothetical protein
MTYEQAVELRTSQLQGKKVEPSELEAAIAVIKTNPTPTPKRAPRDKRPRPEQPPAVPARSHTPWALVGELSPAELRAATDKAWARIGSAG